jgi:hypothetical protein
MGAKVPTPCPKGPPPLASPSPPPPRVSPSVVCGTSCPTLSLRTLKELQGGTERGFLGGASLIPWPIRDITIALGGLEFPGVGRDKTVEIFTRVCSRLNSVCNLRMRVSPLETYGSIIPTTIKIDGRGRVLAESYMPYRGMSPRTSLSQRYDTSELWTNLDIFYVVALHEVGHAVGMPHIEGNNTAVLNPRIDRVRDFTDLDVELLEMLYGKALPVPSPVPSPVPTPDPNPNPPPPVTFVGRIILDVTIEQGKLVVKQVT